MKTKNKFQQFHALASRKIQPLILDMLKSNPGALDIHQATLDQIFPDVRRHWFPKEQQLRWQDSIKKN